MQRFSYTEYSVLPRYVTCLQELLSELLKKVQFLHCADWLDTIDMEKYDDDVSAYKNRHPCETKHGKVGPTAIGICY